MKQGDGSPASFPTDVNETQKVRQGDRPPASLIPSLPRAARCENKVDGAFDYEGIRALFNSICTSLPQAKALNDARRKALKARMTDKDNPADRACFEQIFTRVEQSDFLTGRDGGASFKASFDWVLKPLNWVKVLEGNYANRAKKTGKQDFSDHKQYEKDTW